MKKMFGITVLMPSVKKMELRPGQALAYLSVGTNARKNLSVLGL